jgi:hypothetical protein
VNQQEANALVSKIEAHKAAGGVLYALGQDDEGHPRFWAHREYRAESVRLGFGDGCKVLVRLSQCDGYWVRGNNERDTLLNGREVWTTLEDAEVFFTEAEMFQRFRENMIGKIERFAGFLRDYDDPTFIKWDTKPDGAT